MTIIGPTKINGDLVINHVAGLKTDNVSVQGNLILRKENLRLLPGSTITIKGNCYAPKGALPAGIVVKGKRLPLKQASKDGK